MSTLQVRPVRGKIARTKEGRVLMMECRGPLPDILTKVFQAPLAHVLQSCAPDHPLTSVVHSLNSMPTDVASSCPLASYPDLLQAASEEDCNTWDSRDGPVLFKERTLFIITDELVVHEGTPMLAAQMLVTAGIDLAELEFINVEITTEVRTAVH